MTNDPAPQDFDDQLSEARRAFFELVQVATADRPAAELAVEAVVRAVWETRGSPRKVPGMGMVAPLVSDGHLRATWCQSYPTCAPPLGELDVLLAGYSKDERSACARRLRKAIEVANAALSP